MPSRNRIKVYAPGYAYHLYNRGNNRERIFLETDDYAVFLNLLKRHLGQKQVSDKLGRPYRNLHKEVELLAFCLMPNHYHLLIYQHTDDAIIQLMRSVATSYSGYFNKKYDRVGRVFQDAYRAVIVDQEDYWQHISRYIHLNPRDWRKWEWSSLAYYTGQKQADWVRPNRLLELFEGDGEYADFVADYEQHKSMLDELKPLLAN